MPELERIPPKEAELIDSIVKNTVEQMKKRYSSETTVRRGVHPKDHGCVMARFKVNDSLPEHLRVGVFANPGQVYEAWIRFSNASLRSGVDSGPGKSGALEHGGRGMAMKLLGVTGDPLVPPHGPLTQDFLMINQPVFAFSNAEDYAVLNDVVTAKGDENAEGFFARVKSPDVATAARARRTLDIISGIRSTVFPPAFQEPPASPVDNRYFSGSPFLFGEDRVMKYSANPIDPRPDEKPDLADPHYLRTALHNRLTAPDAKDIVFDFLLQVRTASEIAAKIETDIEDASCLWPEKDHAFESVATITIPPQDFETDERRELCESLTFTPWHGVAEHRPLGGINRLRLAVYEVSTQMRHVPPEPEPAAGGSACGARATAGS